MSENNDLLARVRELRDVFARDTLLHAELFAKGGRHQTHFDRYVLCNSYVELMDEMFPELGAHERHG